MKSVALALISVLLLVAAHREAHSITPIPPRFLHFVGIHGGMNYSNISESEQNLPDLNYESSWQAGLFYEYRSNRCDMIPINNSQVDDEYRYDYKYFNYGIRGGLSFIRKWHDLGDYVRTDDTGQMLGTFNSQVYKNYLMLPINAVGYYKYFHAKAGLYSAVLLDAEMITNDKDEPFEHHFNSFDIGIDVGGGITYLPLALEYSFQYGLVEDAGRYNITHRIDLLLFLGI